MDTATVEFEEFLSRSVCQLVTSVGWPPRPTLEELGPVTVAGRDAIAVAATPRRDVLSSDPGHRSHDRVEVAVDAELGIEFANGKPLHLIDGPSLISICQEHDIPARILGLGTRRHMP
jgi:hypothetical protein